MKRIQLSNNFRMASPLLGLALLTSTFATRPVAAATVPVIESIYSLNSTTTGLSGTGFGATAGTVTVSGTAATVSSWSSTQVQFVLPTGGQRTVQVTLTTHAGTKTSAYLTLVPSVLASSVSDSSSLATISGVSLNGQGNQIHVSPGATVSVTASYTATSGLAGSQGIQFGLSTGNPAYCIYGISSSSGGVSFGLTAPSSPGTYNILMGINSNTCASWDYGIPPASQSIGSIAVY